MNLTEPKIFSRDQLSVVVANIRTPMPGGNEDVGTAIFIGNEKNEAYLLTAAHVVTGITNQTRVVSSDQDGNTIAVDLRRLLGGAHFDFHPQADLAKAKINITSDNIGYISGKCFPYSQIDFSSNPISRDYELTFFGFPLGLGADGAKFSPLTYRSFISSPVITLARADNKVPCDFIITENPSVGGYSGGPMFDLGYSIHGGMTTTKTQTTLHGIVHGTIQIKVVVN